MRQCLIPPIPELSLAVKLLDAAADALFIGNRDLASLLVVNADIPAIASYTKKIVGPLSEEVHRQTTLPVVLPKTERHKVRMPQASAQGKIFERDGWRCRFCGVKVIAREARNLLVKLFPDETHWGPIEYDRHTALYALASSLDHVVPHSRGGANETGNFVTACFCCQFGRGQFTLEEVQLTDPRLREPVNDGWDGLIRLIEKSAPHPN